MNILFITSHEITPQKGGIEKITSIISNTFHQVKFACCFSAYYFPNDDLDCSSYYGKIRLYKGNEYKDIEKFILENSIDIIVNQQLPNLTNCLYEIRKRYKIPILYFQHDRPSIDFYRSVKYYYFLALHGNFKQRSYFIIKLIISPIYILLRKLYHGFLLRKAMISYDSILLLSERFIPLFLRMSMLSKKYTNKINIIGNCLTLDYLFPINKLFKKEKEVLFVGRLVEDRKRISLLIKIWEKIQEKNTENWVLRIVGSGKEESIYKYIVQKRKISNIVFEGQVEDTIPYYQKASIFVMTSDAEGWGLTLTESLQFGVVPIAFDTFESIHDILINGWNGLLVKDNDINLYATNLSYLIDNYDYRMFLAKNALESSKNFSVNIMINKWKKIINKMMDA